MLWVLAVVLAAGIGLVPGVATARSTDPDKARPSLATLRADVAATADRLAASTVAWEKGQETLGALVQRKMLTKQAAEQLEKDAVAAQVRVSSLASALYKNPINPIVTAVLSGDAQGIADMVAVQRAMGRSNSTRQADLRLLSQQASEARQLVQGADDAAKQAIKLQRQLNDQLDVLQRDALASVRRLEEAVQAMRRQAAAAAAARRAQLAAASGGLVDGGPACSSEAPADAINGFLPDSSLCLLRSAPGHRLSRAAAAAFDAMSLAFRGQFNRDLCVTDSYRDYAGQVSVFRRKPNLAAVPGRSNHGWGRALDLCGGVQQFNSEPYQWLKANSEAFGFSHPGWAEPNGSRPEAWHWEFHS